MLYNLKDTTLREKSFLRDASLLLPSPGAVDCPYTCMWRYIQSQHMHSNMYTSQSYCVTAHVRTENQLSAFLIALSNFCANKH